MSTTSKLSATLDWLGFLPEKTRSERLKPLSKRLLADHLYGIVVRYYEGRPISRRKMEFVGYDQRYWNLANAVLITLGLREEGRPSAWLGSSRSQVLRQLGRGVRVAEETATVQVRTPRGEWVELDLHRCHFHS